MRNGPSVVISASIAYDRIMTFRGSFKDYIIPDKVHVLSVSFLLDALRLQRGGVGGNIAYSLALLGESVALVGAVGDDFVDYRATFDQLGIDTEQVLAIAGQQTASAFVMSDLEDNQIVSFYPGPSDEATRVSLIELPPSIRFGIVGATGPAVMRQHVDHIKASGRKLIYDPSQQIIGLPADELVHGIERAWALFANDYEYAMLEQKTGYSLQRLIDTVPLVIVTYGEQGSEIWSEGGSVRIPAAPPTKICDPTGAGDAYRAGFIKGLLAGFELPVTGRLAALSATYAIEQYGTQEHRYTPAAFVSRFDQAFPEYAGAVTVASLQRNEQDAATPISTVAGSSE